MRITLDAIKIEVTIAQKNMQLKKKKDKDGFDIYK